MNFLFVMIFSSHYSQDSNINTKLYSNFVVLYVALARTCTILPAVKEITL